MIQCMCIYIICRNFSFVLKSWRILLSGFGLGFDDCRFLLHKNEHWSCNAIRGTLSPYLVWRLHANWLLRGCNLLLPDREHLPSSQGQAAVLTLVRSFDFASNSVVFPKCHRCDKKTTFVNFFVIYDLVAVS